MHARIRNILLPLILLALLPAWAQEVRHARLFAVPRPGAVVIDGKLDDWDLSGTILVAKSRETSEMQSARVALMYDAEALYIAAAVKDLTPLQNRHDPQTRAGRAWEADALQLRLALDPRLGYPLNVTGTNDQVAHLVLWYFTDRKEPCLRILDGMRYAPPKAFPRGVVPADKFQGAYLMAINKRGYTLEYRIPWATLGAKNPPKAGESVAGALQIQWGAADGLAAAPDGVLTDLLTQPGVPFRTTACWGEIRFAAEGHLPYALTHDGPPEPPLPLTFAYDLPKSGEVTVALLNAQGQPVRHLVTQTPRKQGLVLERWDGLDDTGKPLPAGTYSWKGLYHDPLTTRYLLGVHNAGTPSYSTPDGTGAWGADHGVPSTVCAAGDAMLLAWTGAEAGSGLIRTDLTGKKLWGVKNGAEHVACDGERVYASGGFGYLDGNGISVYALKDGRPLTFGTRAKAALPAGGEEGANAVAGLACANGILYASYAKRNLIVLYDARSGAIRETWSVLAPEWLAVRPDGSLAVISRGGLLAVTRTRQTPLATDHLDDPTGVTVGPDGLLYVANRGALQNVSVFDPAGKFIVNIGRKGGRPRVGRFDQSGMLAPGGVALDAQGRLWVAETLDSPKRISVWETKTGACVNEFFGAGHYATFVSMDPAHEDEVYCQNVVWSVDLDKGTWYPLSTMWRQTTSDDPPACQELRVFTAKNGHQYAWGRWNYARALYLRVGDLFKPVLVSLNVTKNDPYIAWPPIPQMADHAKFPDGGYVWQDANDDLRMSPDEIVRVAGSKYGFSWVDPDLTLTWADGVQYRPVRLEEDGTPVYDFTLPLKSALTGRAEAAAFACSDPADGSLYLIDEDGAVGPRGVARVAKDGRLLWRYPLTGSWRTTLNKPLPRPGQVWGITQPLGVAGQFTGVATYFGPFHLFTRDGLYVARLFQDARQGTTGPDVIAAEAFAGQLVRLRKSGRYLFLGGDTDGRVTEILSLDTVKRFAGTYTLTPADAQVAKAALADYTPPVPTAPRVVIARGRAALATGGTALRLDDAHHFTARLAYDAHNLYLSMTVESPAALTNTILDPRILFKGGNCLDLQLATDPDADPARTAPAPGDLRVLVTTHQGRPTVVLYRPKVAGFTGTPVTLTSPAGSESFDAITVADKVEVEVQPVPAPGHGFTAVVTLPLDLLGWTPTPGAPVRLDVGYLFGDAAGSRCARRAYLFNTGPTAALTNDIPGESHLEPAHWGTATVE